LRACNGNSYDLTHFLVLHKNRNHRHLTPIFFGFTVKIIS
jgi:hypothetical protein